MHETTYRLSFGTATAKEANQHAEDLQKVLARSHQTVTVKQERERTDSQDLGTILVLVLGTEAVVAVAKGIADYLSKYRNVSLTFTDKDRKVVAKNLTAKTAVTVIEEVLRTGKESKKQ
jgi:hypothetical protein